MAEYIYCRNCDSAYCDGCNIYTLATMLQEGKFDCLMDENCSVNRFADVAPVVHGEWELHGNDGDIGGSYWCSRCHANYDEDLFYDGWLDDYHPFNFCPNCGADMRERKGDDDR